MKGRQQKSSVFKGAVQSVTSGISTTLVLLLLGMVAFFVLSANNLSVYVRENLTFSVLLNDMNETAALSLKSELDKEPFVKESVFISKEQALKETAEELGANPAEFLGENPFTASIEVKLKASYANSDSIAMIENKLKQNTNIGELVYERGLIDAVNSNVRKISIFLFALAAILSLISFGLINSTIRLSIYSRRFTIHTMKLVGASWGFIRRPFVMRQVAIGIVSAAVADGLLCGSVFTLLEYQPQLSAIITWQVMLWVSVIVFICGVAITFLCSFFTINKYLRMKAGDLYYI